MKNKVLQIALSISVLLTLCSCNSGSKQDEKSMKDSTNIEKKVAGPDYSGIYKVSAENTCQLTIAITKENQNFNYQIKGENLDCTGKLIIEDFEGEIYFTFDGQIAENAPKVVSAKFVDNSIMVQNYGNSMNEYNYFKQCEEKFLEFKKQ